jgi:predicted metal-dependent phosphoesterase TrpH
MVGEAAGRADLHAHSNASDGTCPPAQVMRRAAAAGLRIVALTDHDTAAGLAEAAAGLPPGLTLLPGMEMSCRCRAGRAGTPSWHSVHMLAYLFDTGEPELAAESERIRASRRNRARAIVDRLAALGTGVTWESVQRLAGGGVVGRPHIARAMAEAGVVRSARDAFGPQWLAPGGRAYVPRYAPSPRRALELVRGAGGVAVLAHPRAGRGGWPVPDGLIADLAAAGLAGVEVYHPDQPEPARARLAALAGRLGLIATGGSDDHGELTGYRIGCDTISAQACDRLISLATGAAPVTAS